MKIACGHKPLHRYWLHWRRGTGSQPLASPSPWYLETTLTVCPHTFLQGQLCPQTPAADGEENSGWKYNSVLWDVHFSSLWSDARNQVSVKFKKVHFWQTDKWWIRVGAGLDCCTSLLFLYAWKGKKDTNNSAAQPFNSLEPLYWQKQLVYIPLWAVLHCPKQTVPDRLLYRVTANSDCILS